jgi:UDP-N-acetylglucosamine 3-dehydrogenase
MLNPSPVRLAVIGAGVMGANHARVASRTSGVELVAIVDVDEDKRGKLAAATGVRSVATVAEVMGDIDAVVIATPTQFHHSVASQCLDAKLHVLVEKPIASSVAEGEDLAQRAAAAGVVLTVGHIERFNPAVRELMQSANAPIHIELTRVGPFTPRVSDNVVVDLMIHDLDLARAIARSEVKTLSSILQSTKTAGPDMAIALIEFENGVTASVTASRISQQKLRRIVVTQDDEVLAGDLVRQDVMIHRMQHVEYVSDAGARIRQSGVVEIPFIENRGEPLMEELRAFVAAIHGGQLTVTAEDGIAALQLAHRVLNPSTFSPRLLST